MERTSRLILLVLSCQLVASKSLGEVDSTWKVDLESGSIESPRTFVDGGRHYYAFRGIPFAQPPVGELRFKDPVVLRYWTGVRNGSVAAPACPQAGSRSSNASVVGAEDCLYLNVFSPGPNSSNLPVMVYIHGGGFDRGNATNYEPTHLMREDVVVVTIQYRLGVLGFLSTGDQVIPGNLGLKDQVMALRWVQDYIKPFGGDPQKVTIFGESAGGISVHYLMLSPMAEGLFQRAIAQSGTALIPEILRDNHRHNSAVLGQMLECEGVDPKALDSEVLYNCLKEVSVERLVNAARGFPNFLGFPMPMTPRVDGVFLPEHPALMIKKGNYRKVDFMTGITRDEGAAVVRHMLLDKAARESLAQNFSVNGPLVFGQEDKGDLGLYVAKRLFYHYLGDINITEENADGAVRLFSDTIFAIPMDLVGEFHQRDAAFGQRTYLYELNHVGQNLFLDSPNITIGKNWVAHGDDIQYLFTPPFLGSMTDPKDLFLSEIITSLWVNFARTGNPTPDLSLGFKWPHISSSELKYLMLQPSPFVRGFTRQKELEFFKNLPAEPSTLLFPERFRSEE